MTSYNGFDPEFRKQVGDQMRMLKNRGKFEDWTKLPCAMCKTRAGSIMAHLENYYDIYSYKPLCVECHLKLHARFKCPNAWDAYLLQLRDGYVSAGFATVGNYFGSVINKEYFAANKNLVSFDPSPDVWYEDLRMHIVDLREFYKAQMHARAANSKNSDSPTFDFPA